MSIGIGSTVWRYDVNYRIYADDKSAPIYRKHWRPMVVDGETSRSWLVKHYGKSLKIPKKGEHRGWALSEQEVDDACWMNDHRYRVSEAVRMHYDAATLRRIAEMVGYTP